MTSSIAVWIDGKMDININAATAKMISSYLICKGWTVRDFTDIGTLVLFSPDYKNRLPYKEEK